MNQELLRIVDSIARDKNIDKESIFVDIEAALLSAARKFYGEADDVACAIDRMSGEIQVRKGETLIDYREFGRIAAQTAKQVLIQKIRENERTSILDEYMEQKGQIISGTVSRFEGGALIVNVGRSEGFLPKSEQIPGETHNTGERIRCLLLDVRDAGKSAAHSRSILKRSTSLKESVGEQPCSKRGLPPSPFFSGGGAECPSQRLARPWSKRRTPVGTCATYAAA